MEFSFKFLCADLDPPPLPENSKFKIFIENYRNMPPSGLTELNYAYILIKCTMESANK